MRGTATFPQHGESPAEGPRHRIGIPESSNTVEANGRMAERALQNIVFAEAHAFARMDLLNPEVLR